MKRLAFQYSDGSLEVFPTDWTRERVDFEVGREPDKQLQVVEVEVTIHAPAVA